MKIGYVGTVRGFRLYALPGLRLAAVRGESMARDHAQVQRRLRAAMTQDLRDQVLNGGRGMACSTGTDPASDYLALKTAWVGKRTMATVAARRQMASAYRVLVRRCVFRGGCGSVASHA